MRALTTGCSICAWCRPFHSGTPCRWRHISSAAQLVACAACIGYFNKEGRPHRNVLLHVVIPIAGIAVFIPAMYAQYFSFDTLFKYVGVFAQYRFTRSELDVRVASGRGKVEEITHHVVGGLTFSLPDLW